MRTPLAIDDDALAAAKQLAEREHKALGDVISAWARQDLLLRARRSPPARNGIPLLAGREGESPVTLALVNQLRDLQP